MKLYLGKVSGQIEFENILFDGVEVTIQILSNLSNYTFCVLFGTYLDLHVEFCFYSSWDGKYTYQDFQTYNVGLVIYTNKKEQRV